MAACLLLALLAAFAALAVARYASSPVWIDALFANAALVSLSAAMAIGLAFRRFSRTGWRIRAALVLGSSAAVARFELLDAIAARPELRRIIDYPKILAASGAVVFGAVSLLLGALHLSEALEGASRSGAGRRGSALALSALSIALALYSLAPLLYLLDLEVNLITFLGLFLLGVAAFGVAAAWRRIFG